MDTKPKAYEFLAQKRCSGMLQDSDIGELRPFRAEYVLRPPDFILRKNSILTL